MVSLDKQHHPSICKVIAHLSSLSFQYLNFGTKSNHGSVQPIQNHNPKTYIYYLLYFEVELNKNLSYNNMKLDL